MLKKTLNTFHLIALFCFIAIISHYNESLVHLVDIHSMCCVPSPPLIFQDVFFCAFLCYFWILSTKGSVYNSELTRTHTDGKAILHQQIKTMKCQIQTRLSTWSLWMHVMLFHYNIYKTCHFNIISLEQRISADRDGAIHSEFTLNNIESHRTLPTFGFYVFMKRPREICFEYSFFSADRYSMAVLRTVSK